MGSEANTKPQSTWVDWVRFGLLSATLLAVLLAALALPVLDKRGVVIVDGNGDPASFWLLWELFSILVTGAVTAVFWLTCFIGGQRRSAIFEGSRVLWGGWAVLVLIAFAWCFFKAGSTAYHKGALVTQVGWLVGGVAATIVLELLGLGSTYKALERHDRELKEISQELSRNTVALRVRDRLGDRENLAKYLCFSDGPIAAAIACIALFVAVVRYLNVQYPEPEMRAFVAGVVAIQLLYSNFVFWLESFGDVPLGQKVLNSLPPELDIIPKMLRPEEELPEGMTRVEWAENELKKMFPPDRIDSIMDDPDGTPPNDAGEE